MSIEFKRKIKEYIFVTLGVMLIAFSFSFFIDPYSLDIGGVSGLAVIFKVITGKETWSWLFILIFNVLLLIIGLIFLGKNFLLKTMYGSLTYPLWAKAFNFIYEILVKYNDGKLLLDNNVLLVTLFSAIIMGFGLGICVKHGGTTGGTEILQNIVYKYWKMPYSISLFVFDGIVVLLGFFFIKDVDGKLIYENLLCEILFIYLSGVVMDQIVFSGFNKRAVMIISDKTEEIKKKILHDFERGVTEVTVVGGYTGQNRTQLICVLSSNQFNKLKMLLNEIDPKAFYYVMRASEVGGEGFTYE